MSRGKSELKAASANIKTTQDVTREAKKLLGAGGALYNAGNTGISTKGNQLDLSQYGNEALNFINASAATKKMPAFNSVNDAFQNEQFLRYLATPETR